MLKEVIQRDLLVALEFLLLLLHAALFNQLAGQPLILYGIEDIAGGGHFGKTGDLHRTGGAGFLHLLALIVGHHADTAHGGPRDHGFAGMKGAGLDKNGGHRAAAGIQLGFDDGTLGHAVGIGGQLHGIGHQQDHLQQVIQPHAGLGGNGDADGIAAPFLGDQLVFGKLLLDAVGVGFGFIHLVDGDDDGNAGRLGMVDGLHRLGHDAVIGSHHQHGDIGDLGAAGSHRGEGGVAGGIQEGDGTAIHLHLIGADVLGNAAGFSGNDAGFADSVQDGGLAMIDVAHDHHDGRPGLLRLLLVLDLKQAVFDGDDDLLGDLGADLHSDQRGGIKIDNIADGGHHAQAHQLFDDFAGLDLEGEGQFADRHFLGERDLQTLTALTLQLQTAHLFLLALFAAEHRLAAAGGFLVELLLFGKVIPHIAGRGNLLVALVVFIEVDLAGAHIHGGAGHGSGGKVVFALGPLLLGGLLADLDRLAGGGGLLRRSGHCRTGGRRHLAQVGTQAVPLLGTGLTALLRTVPLLRAGLATLLRTAALLRTGLASLLRTGRGRRRLGGRGGRLFRGLLRRLGRGGRGLFGGLCGRGRSFGPGLAQLKIFPKIPDGMLLGIVLKDEVQLIAGKHRLGFSRLAAEALLQQRHQLLAVQVQVAGDLVQFIFFDHLFHSSSSSVINAWMPRAKFSSQTARIPLSFPVTAESVCIVQGRVATGRAGSFCRSRRALRGERSSASRTRKAAPFPAASSTASIPAVSRPARRQSESIPKTRFSSIGGCQLLFQFCHYLIGYGAFKGTLQPFGLLCLAEALDIAAEIRAPAGHSAGKIKGDGALRGMDHPDQLLFGEMLAAAGAHPDRDLLLLHCGRLLSVTVGYSSRGRGSSP